MFSLIQHRPFVKSIYQKPIAIYKKPILYQSPRKFMIPRASGIDWEFSSYIIGKGIILFTLYYCTTNWWYYRRSREDAENKKDKKK